MGLLDTIKTLLGIGSTDKKQERDNVGVTVERDTRDVQAETETEAAVKSPADEVGEDGDDADVENEAATDDGDEAADLVAEAEPEEEDEDEAETEAEAEEQEAEPEEPEPEADDDEAEAEPEAEDEPEEAEAEPEAEAEDEPEEAEAEPEAEADDEPEEEPEPDGASDSPEVLKGIGPAYARRLAEAGVDTVADLAVADPETVAEEIDVSVKRVSRWVDRAKEY